MICKNPYVKASTPGGDQLMMKCDKELRLANTPFGCGQCLPCRINKSRTWTMRIVMESCLYDSNTFLTLTYTDENIPKDDHGTPILYKRDAQLWLKRFRELHQKPFRYFLVGEYGNNTERPHFHTILFNVDPNSSYDTVLKSWDNGFVYTGNVEPKSAAYIAGYCMKKMTNITDDRLGTRPPEFMLSSRGTHNKEGGIGYPYLRQIARKTILNKNIPQLPIVQMKIGRKSYPIGQYLSKKWIDMLQIDPKITDDKLYDYQTKLFDEFMFKENSYIHEMLVNMQTQVARVERRYSRRQNKRTDTL